MMMNWQPENLKDEVVALFPLKETDFEPLFKVVSDPLIWEQHPIKDRYKFEVFKSYFDSALSSNSAFTIVEQATNEIIGCTRFYDYKPEESSVAIGYTFLARAYWGGAYNRSAKALLLTYAFERVNKVYFHVGINNIRSQAAVLKLGAVKVREVKFDHSGEMLPHYEYVLQKPEAAQAPGSIQ